MTILFVVGLGLAIGGLIGTFLAVFCESPVPITIASIFAVVGAILFAGSAVAIDVHQENVCESKGFNYIDSRCYDGVTEVKDYLK